MAFGGFNDNRQPAPMADINVTPMVDVMLVLLVIFIITAPLFTRAIKLDLPKAAAPAAPQKPEVIPVSIDAQGSLFWGDAAVTLPELGSRLAEAAKKNPSAELQLRADKATRYDVIAQVMAAAQGNGLSKIGFVTEAPATTPPAEERKS